MKPIKLFEAFINENVSNSEILDLVDNIQAVIQKIKAENKSKGSKLFTIAGPLVKELHSLMESVENNDDIIFENEIAQKRGYSETEAAKALLEAIPAMAKLMGRNTPEFTELIRCQNLRAIAGLSKTAIPETGLNEF